MKEHELESYLMEVFDWSSNEDGEIKDFETFEANGLLTNNSGIVLTMRDGSKFQLKIVKANWFMNNCSDNELHDLIKVTPEESNV